MTTKTILIDCKNIPLSKEIRANILIQYNNGAN